MSRLYYLDVNSYQSFTLEWSLEGREGRGGEGKGGRGGERERMMEWRGERREGEEEGRMESRRVGEEEGGSVGLGRKERHGRGRWNKMRGCSCMHHL